MPRHRHFSWTCPPVIGQSILARRQTGHRKQLTFEGTAGGPNLLQQGFCIHTLSGCCGKPTCLLLLERPALYCPLCNTSGATQAPCSSAFLKELLLTTWWFRCTSPTQRCEWQDTLRWSSTISPSDHFFWEPGLDATNLVEGKWKKAETQTTHETNENNRRPYCNEISTCHARSPAPYASALCSLCPGGDEIHHIEMKGSGTFPGSMSHAKDLWSPRSINNSEAHTKRDLQVFRSKIAKLHVSLVSQHVQVSFARAGTDVRSQLESRVQDLHALATDISLRCWLTVEASWPCEKP